MVQVFISHASGDPDWPEAEVEALAQALNAQGVQVWLDLWKEREDGQLAPAEWRDWMRKALDKADHVLCLASALYQGRAARDVSVPGGFGVALETSVLDRQIYQAKQRVNRWVLLVHKDGVSAVSVAPDFLYDICPEYSYPSARDKLVTDVTRRGRGNIDKPPSKPTDVLLVTDLAGKGEGNIDTLPSKPADVLPVLENTEDPFLRHLAREIDKAKELPGWESWSLREHFRIKLKCDIDDAVKLGLTIRTESQAQRGLIALEDWLKKNHDPLPVEWRDCLLALTQMLAFKFISQNS